MSHLSQSVSSFSQISVVAVQHHDVNLAERERVSDIKRPQLKTVQMKTWVKQCIYVQMWVNLKRFINHGSLQNQKELYFE